MSDFRIDQISNQAGTAGPDIAGITTFSSTSGMLMPSGVTEYRGGRGRGLFGGGESPAGPTAVNTIEYITISTASNAFDFGDLSTTRKGLTAYSSSVRGIFSGGGVEPAPSANGTNIIEYTTISSTGNTFDFGDLTGISVDSGGCSNSTRGLHIGGIGAPGAPTGSNSTTVNYLTIASLGNASFFGDLNIGVQLNGCTSSSTRGFSCGGNPVSSINSIQFCTISTLGNFQDFGDLLSNNRNNHAVSDGNRAVVFGGVVVPPGTFLNVIQYFSMSSLGDAVDFGDLSQTVLNGGAVSNKIRGVYAGGSTPSTLVNNIEFITIATTGNATDFGDLRAPRGTVIGSCSDAHGGLGD
jgi:hypothetical protein